MNSPQRVQAIEIARAFHEAYERLAPSTEYETRKESAVPWDDVPIVNRTLMANVVQELLQRQVISAYSASGSVLQDWVMKLPLRYQGTLVAGLRGCDTVPKFPYDSTPRQLVAYLRYVTLNPADKREIGIEGAFMQDHPPKSFRASDLGHLPEHFYSHVMHAYQIVGYEHPDREISDRCEHIYIQLVNNLHLRPESRLAMMNRLTEDRIASGNVLS